jgi:hypothetical protein
MMPPFASVKFHVEGHDELNAEIDDVQAQVADLIERGASGEIQEDEFNEELVALMALMLLTAVNEGRGVAVDTPINDAPQEIQEQYSEAMTQTRQSARNLWREVENGAFSENEQRTAERAREMAENRGNLWGASLADFYWLGLVFNEALERLEWRLGATEQHCGDCLRLDGQVHTRTEWIASGWRPKTRGLECGGWLCDCSLVPTGAQTQGGF